MDIAYLKRKINNKEYRITLHATNKRLESGLILKKGEKIKASKNICAICGGRLKKEKISFDFRFNGQLVVIDNLPVEVCLQCGEKVLSPAVSRKIDEVLVTKKKPKKIINIPVYQISP